MVDKCLSELFIAVEWDADTAGTIYVTGIASVASMVGTCLSRIYLFGIEWCGIEEFGACNSCRGRLNCRRCYGEGWWCIVQVD